jgi:chaperonin GroEL (HSP60 family)
LLTTQGICGNIFDAKCTNLVDGHLFGQSGRLRICKPCEAIVHGTDDDSSVYSDDVDRVSVSGVSFSPRRGSDFDHFAAAFSSVDSDTIHVGDDHMHIGTPTMGVPISRKAGESKRRSAIIEFDGQHSLPRPSSSRSLKSLSGRPRSSSHRRHYSRHGHQHMKSLKPNEDRAPFQRHDSEAVSNGLLPAFHHDNIIDPDLAPFLSDEGSSEEDTPSIFATLSSEPQSPGKTDSEKASFAGILASVRRGKPRGQDKSLGAVSVLSRDADNLSTMGKNAPRPTRKRNLSVGSLYHTGHSPRRSKSNSLLKGFGIGHGGLIPGPVPASKTILLPSTNSKMIRSSSMRGASAPAVELNQASLQHVRRLLRQMLQDANILDVKRWEKALMPILLQCTDDVNPDIQRNDDIDIRHYIKLKKIPGGKPGDTSYVSGVVFTKNLALKSMARSIPTPRIAIVTFPIEYARHQQHFMSLEPVIAQEREYLRNLVKRIAALNPQVLLVEKNVAGLALEFLEKENIAVVYNVKPSVLNAVSRCTQTKQISSADKLAIDHSQLGRCASFDVKTYVHGTMKKTFIYLSGCQKDLGCTIALRGAEMGQLRKLKRITEFMCYVVYNLKLETCVMRDEYVLIPATLSGGTLASGRRRTTESAIESSDGTPPDKESGFDKLKSKKKSQRERQDEDIDGAMHGPEDAITSLTNDVNLASPLPAAMPSFYNDVVESHKTKIISASPFVKFMQPYLLTQAREQEAKLIELKRLRDQYASIIGELADEKGSDRFELVQPEMVHRLVQKPSKQVRDFLFAVHDAQYEKALHSYQTQKRQWEAYLSSNASLFDPYNHQRIAVLYSMVNTKTSNPCVGPDVIALSFYNEHDLDDDFLPDITLGQYVEDLCHGAPSMCTANGCDEPMFNHHRQYVHGEAQMSVIVQKYPSRMRGLQNTILMWSCCRICGQETQVIPMSENTWKYSFGKYLELTFWSTALHPRAHACPHDIHRDHVRYFGFNNFAVRIQYDAVELHEIIVPRATITWKVDSDLQLKNEHYLRFKARLDRFMSSVKARIESIHVESVSPEKIEACKVEVETLKKRANEDHEALTRNLQDKYMNSRYYEIIPLNRAAKAVHETSIAWDDAFAEFEKDFFPSEKDIRRLAQIQINRFLDRNDSSTSIGSIEETVEDAETQSPTLVAHPSPDAKRKRSTMSPEDTQNVLTSVVQEQGLNEKSSEEAFKLPPAKLDDDTQDTSNLSSKRMSVRVWSNNGETADVASTLDITADANFISQGMMQQLGFQPEPYSGTSISIGSESTVQPRGQIRLQWKSFHSQDSFSDVFLVIDGDASNLIYGKHTINERKIQDLVVQTPIEAFEREDVKHLDLAVPTDFPTSNIARTDSVETTHSQMTRESSDAGSTNSAQSQSLELSPQVTETVHQMRTNASLEGNNLDAPATELNLPETRIPRLADPGKATGRTSSPPMTRTRSQPQATTLTKRDNRSSNDTTASSSASALSTYSKTEKLRNFISDPARALERRIGGGTFRSGRAVSRSLIPRSVPGQRNDSKVLTLKHHFEQLSKEFEKQRLRERQLRAARGRQARAYPLASSNPVVEVYRDAHEAVQENDEEDDDSSTPARRSTDTSHIDEGSTTGTTATEGDSQDSPLAQSGGSQEEQKSSETGTETTPETGRTSDTEGGEAGEGSDGEQGILEDIDIPESGPETQPLSPSDSQLDLTELKQERTSLLKMLTSFWSERSASGWTPLDYPFLPNEHVWGDSDIIVREDEPSSLIALALSSTDYQAKLRSFRNLAEMDASEADIDASIERNLLHPKNTNIRYAFQNRGVRAQCKIFYAESFDALRRKCGVADRFVESLSRCLKWDSKGGKTKSLFLKTLDDRFILKSLSQVEVAAFFKFAPNYFAFMHENLFHGLPSVIAKMMGLFQVTIRSPGSGLEFNWFMLVMENLFYDRSPNRRFDLKGSMRNRKIQSTGERDEVLLDENLVDIIFEKPIFVREHTMKLLKASVWNDTLFLSKQNVMDYSLMAGFDDEAKEIIVGIIGTSHYLPSYHHNSSLTSNRLHSHIYMGQKTRNMDQRPWQE